MAAASYDNKWRGRFDVAGDASVSGDDGRASALAGGDFAGRSMLDAACASLPAATLGILLSRGCEMGI